MTLIQCQLVPRCQTRRDTVLLIKFPLISSAVSRSPAQTETKQSQQDPEKEQNVYSKLFMCGFFTAYSYIFGLAVQAYLFIYFQKDFVVGVQHFKTFLNIIV